MTSLSLSVTWMLFRATSPAFVTAYFQVIGVNSLMISPSPSFVPFLVTLLMAIAGLTRGTGMRRFSKSTCLLGDDVVTSTWRDPAAD